MAELKISNELRGDLGETIFEHYCVKQGFCYIKLEQIYNTLTPKRKLAFCHGRDRIEIRIPEELINEIWEYSIPINGKDNRPYFVFDYLTIPLNDNIKPLAKGEYKFLRDIPARAFYWIEVKTGKSQPSVPQLTYAERATIKVKLFRVKLENFDRFEVEHETLNVSNYRTLNETASEYGNEDNILNTESGKIIITIDKEE